MNGGALSKFDHMVAGASPRTSGFLHISLQCANVISGKRVNYYYSLLFIAYCLQV